MDHINSMGVWSAVEIWSFPPFEPYLEQSLCYPHGSSSRRVFHGFETSRPGCDLRPLDVRQAAAGQKRY